MKAYQKLLIFLAVFILLRIVFIFIFPPFTDESIYVRWGQLMIANPLYRWASLSYVHRQPLAFWIFGIGSFLMSNPVIGARLLVLLVNIPTFFFVYSLTKRISDEKTALLSSAILAVSPVCVLFQSLAIMDGLILALASFIVWIFLEDWHRKPWAYEAMIGLAIGVSLWIKTTGLLLLLLSALSLVIKIGKDKTKLTGLLLGLMILVLIPILLLMPLTGQPDFHFILSEPDSFAFTVTEFMHVPVSAWITNTYLIAVSLIIYLGPVVVAPVFAKQLFRKKYGFIIGAWFVVPIVALIFWAKNLQIRYVAFSFIVLIPFAAYGLSRVTQKLSRMWVIWVGMALFFAYACFFVAKPVQFFSLFPKLSKERDYALSWPSGYGIPELVRWIDAHVPPGGQILLAVADSMGNPSDFILAYYYFKPNVHVTFVTLTNTRDFQKLHDAVGMHPIYLVTRSTLLSPATLPYLIPVKMFTKPESQETVGLYQITFAK